MSARRPDGPTANNATATAAITPYRPTGRPTVLPSIGHPPDFAAVVVTDQERAIRRDQNTDRPPPAQTVGTLPTNDKIVYTHGAASATVHLDAHDLGSGRHGPIPRAVQRDECVTAILAGELCARVEREAERRGVRLHRDRRRLHVRAVRRSVLGIGLPGKVALRPAVIAAVFDDVDMLGR